MFITTDFLLYQSEKQLCCKFGHFAVFHINAFYLGMYPDLHWYHCCCRSVVSDSLCPMDCSLPGSTVHGIFQIVEWVAISPGDTPNPGNEPGSAAPQADSSSA